MYCIMFYCQIFLEEYVDKSAKPLEIHHFYFPMALHGLGLSGALITFMIESFWFHAAKKFARKVVKMASN